MRLRSYQSKAVSAIFEQWQEHNSTLLVLPTGTGKTVVFSHVIKRFPPCRVMVLAHREELIRQAADKIERVTGERCTIEMADHWADFDMFARARVVVSSIQTQISGHAGKGRMSRFDPHAFGLLIIDEAHHATAPSYRKVINHYRQNPSMKILGPTATPDRADEKALAEVFDTCAFDYGVLDAINDGYLVPISQTCVNVEGLDYSQCRTTAGDLNGADLSKVMEYEENLHRIAHPTMEIVGDRKAIVFAASVAHAERLAEIFNRHRSGSADFVSGETPKDQRSERLARFAAGDLRIMVNVGVLTEGYDEPGVQVIVMARPTKSRSLYAQMVGRGTRPLPGLVDAIEDVEDDGYGEDCTIPAELRRMAIIESAKPHLEVIDFVGNAGRHKLVNSADILGGKRSDETIERAKAKAAAASGPVDMGTLLEESEKELHEEKERQREIELRQRRQLVAKATYKTYSVDPFDVLHIESAPVRAWDRSRPSSEKQQTFLARNGIDASRLSAGQASQLIDEIISRNQRGQCTFRQARILERHGYSSQVSRQQASQIIDQIKANGWRQPKVEEVLSW